jgi:GNAT superfamily N-acetyltransferase
VTGAFAVRDAILPDDEPHFVRFIDGLQAFEFAFEPNRRRDATVGAEYLAVLMAGVAAQNGKIFVLADTGGIPVGWAVALIERDEVYVSEDCRTYGLIAELYIDEAARGKRGGSRLIAACEDHFRSLGVTLSALGVLWGNENARGLYGSLGYAPTSLRLRRTL